METAKPRADNVHLNAEPPDTIGGDRPMCGHDHVGPACPEPWPAPPHGVQPLEQPLHLGRAGEHDGVGRGGVRGDQHLSAARPGPACGVRRSAHGHPPGRFEPSEEVGHDGRLAEAVDVGDGAEHAAAGPAPQRLHEAGRDGDVRDEDGDPSGVAAESGEEGPSRRSASLPRAAMVKGRAEAEAEIGRCEGEEEEEEGRAREKAEMPEREVNASAANGSRAPGRSKGRRRSGSWARMAMVGTGRGCAPRWRRSS